MPNGTEELRRNIEKYKKQHRGPLNKPKNTTRRFLTLELFQKCSSLTLMSHATQLLLRTKKRSNLQRRKREFWGTERNQLHAQVFFICDNDNSRGNWEADRENHM